MELTAEIQKRFARGPSVEASLKISGDAPVTVLFGPSGAGKTTVLRCIAGLETMDKGRIVFNGTVWTDTASQTYVPPQRRSIGFLFQDYALFPHLSVEANVAYGLSKAEPVERRRRMAEVESLLQVLNWRTRLPSELSRGQQQRVALARAIAPAPKLLLLDEPFSALDKTAQDSIRADLGRLLRRLQIPAIVVTHDWTDALGLGDEMIVMSAGRILQQGRPQEVFAHPQHREIAAAAGVETIAEGRVGSHANGVATVAVGATEIAAAADAHVHDCYVCIRGEDVTLEKGRAERSSARNHLKGVIRDIGSKGALIRVVVNVGFDLVALVTRQAADDLLLQTGEEVYAVFKASAVHLIRREDR